jgi:hypothetical protein
MREICARSLSSVDRMSISGRFRWMPAEVAAVEGSVFELVAVLISRLGSSILTKVGERVGGSESSANGDVEALSGGSDGGGERVAMCDGAICSCLSSLPWVSELMLVLEMVRFSLPVS